MVLNICNFIQRTEQVPVELDISAIEEYILLLLLCVLASTLCKYTLRKGGLFVLSWENVRQVRRGSISSELQMCGGGVRSILLVPLVTRCIETIYIYVYGAGLFYVCCSNCVGVGGNVCCVAAVVKYSFKKSWSVEVLVEPLHPVFNPTIPYRYLLPTMYMFMADIVYLGCELCPIVLYMTVLQHHHDTTIIKF